MIRVVVLLVTGLLWAVMMSFLVRFEVIPFLEYQATPSYGAVFRGIREPVLERRSVHLGQENCGLFETLFEPRPDGTYRLRTRMKLKLKHDTLGDLALSGQSTVHIDELFQLADFSIDCKTRGMPIRISGKRRGAKLDVRYEVAFLPPGRRELDFPKDALIGDEFMPFHGGAKLGVGKKWRVQTINMLGADSVTTSSYASVERREKIRWNGEDVWTYVVEVRRKATDDLPWHVLWVDEQGVLLVEQMSFDKLTYRVALEERRTMTAEEAEQWEW